MLAGFWHDGSVKPIATSAVGAQMNDGPNYVRGYAVIRVDGPGDDQSRVRDDQPDGEMLPAPGPSHVTVKEVVMTPEEARREVMRLNSLNVAKGCRYYWQLTHIFLDGKSHGSGLITGAQGDEP